jgi:type-F conjugative transfer system pilin assembly protein TrbC
MMRLSLIILAVLATYSPAIAGSIQDLATKAQKYSKGILQDAEKSLPKPQPAMEEAAKKTYDNVASPEYQLKVSKEAERMRRELFKTGDAYADYYAVEKKAPDSLAASERIYIFISESVPMSTLRAYAADISRLRDPNIVMVLNGFVGNKPQFEPTVGFMARVIERDSGCVEDNMGGGGCEMLEATVMVDPNLFERYRPKVVPAIVFASGVSPALPDVSEGDDDNSPAAASWWMIYGDASLRYALEFTNREAKAKSLEHLLSRLAH